MSLEFPLPKRPAGAVRFGPFVLEADEARLAREGEPLPLAGRPLEVLALLVANPGRLLTKDVVLDAVWGHRHVSESVLKGAVNLLRLTLGDDAKAPLYVETVPRRGYRFIAPVQAVAAAAPPAATPPARPDGLPAWSEPPLGRAAELALLLQLLEGRPLVTVTGLGGVGKTCLALAAAAARGGRCWLLRMDELAEPALLVPTLAQQLQLGREATASADALARALADDQGLLLLDNAEHLIDAVAALCRALLAAAPGVRLLVTSQLPLRLSQETVLPLAPLALPADLADPAPVPDSYAAAQLLVQRIRQHQPQWQPGASEHADLAAICRALDGVPLALELAAARVPLLGLAGVRARLDQRFMLLTRGPRDVHQRHRTLAAALDWTFGLLSPREREALQQVAVFAGPFSAEDAEGVLGDDALEAVEELRARSLLVAEPGPLGLRLRLYDSVRGHALQVLAASGSESQARLRLLAWMARRFAGLWQTDGGHPPRHWLPAARADLETLRAALRFGLADDAPPEATPLAVALAVDVVPLWRNLGQHAECMAWLQAAHRRAAAVPEALAARLDLAAAVFSGHTQQGDPGEALARLRTPRVAALAAADPLWRHLAQFAEVQLLTRLGFESPGQEAALVQQMQASLQPHWPPLMRRFWLHCSASLKRRSGDWAGTLASAREAKAMLLAEGADSLARGFWFVEVQALMLLERWPDAEAAARALVADIRAAGELRQHPFALGTAAALFMRRGLAVAERETVLSALRSLAGGGTLWWLADALPWAAWHDGRPADAARLQARADALADGRGEQRGPLFGGFRSALLGLLGDGVALADPPADDAQALDLALGPGTAAAVLPPPAALRQAA